ncbi:MAG: OadG family protein [Clostridia bacterium]|nr:OadG family protein [Clostridia bacterium]
MNGILLSASDFITKKVGEEIVPEQLTTTMNFADRISYALQKSLIGMIIVFGVLAIIWLVLSLFKFVFYKDPNKKTEEIKAAETPAETVVFTPTVNNDGEIVAAIIAAISAMRNEAGVADGFRVVSFKRVTNRPWNKK